MKLALEQEALFYFYKKTDRIERRPTLFNGHYYYLFRYHDEILFHTVSLVTFCHISAPEKFYKLSQTSVRQVFTKYRRVYSQRINHIFRCIKEDEFWDLVRSVSRVEMKDEKIN